MDWITGEKTKLKRKSIKSGALSTRELHHITPWSPDASPSGKHFPEGLEVEQQAPRTLDFFTPTRPGFMLIKVL